MKIIIIAYIFSVLALFASPLQAMTCAQFNSLGHEANSLDQVANSSATSDQANEFLPVIADHAGKISIFIGFSSRKKALNLIRKKNMLGVYVRDSLALTRGECFLRPSEPMNEVAIEIFDYMLDVLAKKI